jgi:dTDP-4-amino-4,6-dideoxygalactose transaminase
MNTAITMIPQANPGAGYRALKPQIDAAVARVLASGWYVLGEEGRGFEAEFAAWLGVAHAVGCANGTDALALALRALGVGPGAAVATVSHTAVATVAAIEMVGAVPVLVDIDPLTYTMDPAELAEVLARPPAGLPPIRAVIPVHLYGQPAEMDPILAACARHDATVIEDCSQAHGAMLGGRRVGTMSDIATFSLYPTKNLGALGDGGVIATRDAATASRLAALRQYGWRTHYISEAIGVNSRLDEMQAAILRAKLPHLDAQNARRRAIAAAYDVAVADAGWAAPVRREGVAHVYHQYVVRVAERASVQAALRGMGVGTGVHYPVPVHLQPAYLGRVALGPGGCVETEAASREVMSLPMYPELGDAEVERVCGALRGMGA